MLEIIDLGGGLKFGPEGNLILSLEDILEQVWNLDPEDILFWSSRKLKV